MFADINKFIYARLVFHGIRKTCNHRDDRRFGIINLDYFKMLLSKKEEDMGYKSTVCSQGIDLRKSFPTNMKC